MTKTAYCLDCQREVMLATVTEHSGRCVNCERFIPFQVRRESNRSEKYARLRDAVHKAMEGAK